MKSNLTYTLIGFFIFFLIPYSANAEAGGAGLLFAFLILFIVFPFAAALIGGCIKRYIIGIYGQIKPSWSRTLITSFGEFIVGVAGLLAWWNFGVKGILSLVIYIVITYLLNFWLSSNKFLAASFSLLAPLIALAFLVFGPIGDHSPTSRFSEVVRNLFE